MNTLFSVVNLIWSHLEGEEFHVKNRPTALQNSCGWHVVGGVSWADLSILLSLGKLGNERLRQAGGSCGVYTFLFLSSPTHWKPRQDGSFFFLLLKPYALSNRIHQKHCLASNWKAWCYIRRQWCFPCGEKNELFRIKCCCSAQIL